MRGRLGLAAAAAAALAVVLSGCSAKGVVSAIRPPAVSVSTPAMATAKAKAGVEDCPAPQVAHGVLPDVTLKCLGGGRSVNLSTLKGPLILNNFQAGCTLCRVEMPALEAFHKAHPNIPVLGIDGEDYLAPLALQQAISRGVTYPMVADPNGVLQKTVLRIHGHPWWFFLSADGRITSHIGGLNSLADVTKVADEALGLHL